MNTRTPTKSRMTLGRKAKLAGAAVLTAIVTLVGIAGPAAAAERQVYASSTRNGLSHSGWTQYVNGNRNFNYSVYFNDRPGDQFCTLLRVRAYATNGAVDTFTGGTVCGGRSGTVSRYLTAPTFHSIYKVEIWTVRADGNLGSFVWQFTP